MFAGLLASVYLITTQMFSAICVRITLLHTRNSGRKKIVIAEIKLTKRVGFITR